MARAPNRVAVLGLVGLLGLLVPDVLAEPVAAPVTLPELDGGGLRDQADDIGARFVREDATCTPSNTSLDTTARLQKLRELMAANGVDAYIIPSDDEHGSEYTAEPDHRRQWISGFVGSAGDAVVTASEALLWTDSRYWVQATRQLDCNWKLMRKGSTDVPSIDKWLGANLSRSARIGADPRLLSYTLWSNWDNYLAGIDGPRMLAVEKNLVDEAWGTDRPEHSAAPIEPLDIMYTGMAWQRKVENVRESMQASGYDILVVSALDDCAWLLNMRSGEVPYTPVFRCYVLVGMNTLHVFLPEAKITQVVRDHLCDPDLKTEIHPHQDVWTVLPALAEEAKSVALTSAAVYHTGSSFKLYKAVPMEKAKFVASPILYMKAKKNAVEAMGMRRAHVKDAVALMEMMSILAEEVPAGKYWDEQKVVEVLEKLRRQQQDSHGPSFDTIAAFGQNAALPHYEPTADTNVQITTDNLFMLDSGGQYSEGTTDVTRTMHYGTPSALQIEVYTGLLKGCIALASTKFPKGYTMQNLEIMLRGPLFSYGLQYGHGSTHGIGHFLGVHESFDYAYEVNFFGSQEPGFYQEGEFGMRLENIVQVVPAEVKFISIPYLETTTLVPYERKLIATHLLTQNEIQWLNTYNQRIRIAVGPELMRQGKVKVYKWLLDQTQPYC